MPWVQDIVGVGVPESRPSVILHVNPLTSVKLAKMIGILVRVN
jgi:hypothetical protein